MQAFGERTEETNERRPFATETIRGLDETHPSSLGQDLAAADITDSDIEQYLRLHAGLATPFTARAAIQERVRSFEEKPEDFGTDEGPSTREM